MSYVVYVGKSCMDMMLFMQVLGPVCSEKGFFYNEL